MTSAIAPDVPSSESLTRPGSSKPSKLPDTTSSFFLGPTHRSYKHQFANIYFVRLRLLKETVEKQARRKWKNVAEKPQFIPRVLEVKKGQLCVIVGTVYMEMPLKPNVLEDIARDHSVPPPPPIEKYYSEQDSVTLEDESGRIQLVGEKLKSLNLVTGIIMAVLGMETDSGGFAVVDACFAGLAPQARCTVDEAGTGDGEESANMDIDERELGDEWIGVISGLDIGSSSPSDAQMQMLVEYLTGEAGEEHDRSSSSRISRLIIAGNSLAPVTITEESSLDRKKNRFGAESTNFSTHPTQALSAFLLDLTSVMPVSILPGASDPTGTLMPQQAMPKAMFGTVKNYDNFASETNPSWLGVGEKSILVHSGQPLSDMFKYLPSPPATRLGVAASTLYWRHMAPTAPDTLWCYPYFTTDPFILHSTPDIYLIGNQPKFQTSLVEEEADEEAGRESAQRCRIVLIPGFAETGTLVLVNPRTLEVRTIQFEVQGMGTGTKANGTEANANGTEPGQSDSKDVDAMMES